MNCHHLPVAHAPQELKIAACHAIFWLLYPNSIIVMAKSPERHKIEAAIKAIIAKDPGAINADIANRVNLELGVALTSRLVGEIRRSIGIGTMQIMWDNVRADLADVPLGQRHIAELNLKDIALMITVNCVRNGIIEAFHVGLVPKTKTGDFSDVTVVTPFGEIPWTHVSRISDIEMKAFNIQVVNRLYTALSFLLDPAFLPDRETYLRILKWNFPTAWDKPVLDANIVNAVRNASESAHDNRGDVASRS